MEARNEMDRYSRTLSRVTNPRLWRKEQKGSFAPEASDFEIVDARDYLVSHGVCSSVETAGSLIDAGLVEIGDSHTLGRFTGGIIPPPGSDGYVFTCQGARLEQDTRDDTNLVDVQDVTLGRVTVYRARQSSDATDWVRQVSSDDGMPTFSVLSGLGKYISPKGAPGCALFLPEEAIPSPYRSKDVLWIVEGEKKAIWLAEAGIAAVSIPGVENWQSRESSLKALAGTGTNPPALDPLLEDVVSEYQQVVIAFDADIQSKPQVMRAAAKLAVALGQLNIPVNLLLLPVGGGKGVDDILATGSDAEMLRSFVVGPAMGARNLSDFLAGGAEDVRLTSFVRWIAERANVMRSTGISAKPAHKVVGDLLAKAGVTDRDEQDALAQLAKELTSSKARLEHVRPALFSYLSENFAVSDVAKYATKAIGKAKVISPLPPTSKHGPLQRSIHSFLEDEKVPSSSHLANTLANDWAVAQKATIVEREVVPAVLPGVAATAFHVLPAPVPGPQPAWDEFLARVTCARTFMIWLGSVLTHNHHDRRAMWLAEEEGGTGKSSVVGALQHLFGAAFGSMSTHVDYKNQFAASMLEGKRLVVIPECTQARALYDSQLKAWTGGDTLRIENKGQDAYLVDNHTRWLIVGNTPPEVADNPSRSRLIYMSVAPLPANVKPDHRYVDRLIAELPHLVCNALEEYRAAGSKVVLSPACEAMLDAAMDAGKENAHALIDSELTLAPDAKLPMSVLADLCGKGKGGSQLYKDVRNVLKDLPGVTKKKVWVNGRTVDGFAGVGVADKVSRALVRAG